jgi:hypothetical protein
MITFEERIEDKIDAVSSMVHEIKERQVVIIEKLETHETRLCRVENALLIFLCTICLAVLGWGLASIGVKA